MKSLRAVIVEDEPSGLENLRWKLKQNCPDIEIIAECENGATGIQALKKLNPDLLFLDIMLGDMTGFDVLKAIKYPSFEVIFTTSYDDYAIQAIKNSALDYLLKPVDVDELLDAVGKARAVIGQKDNTPPPTPTGNGSRMGFPISTGQLFLELEDIIYAIAEDNVAIIYLTDNHKQKEVRLTKALGWLEDLLTPHSFCRIHHSYLINLNHLKEYIRNDGGYAVMSNGKAFSISRRRKDLFLEKLKTL